MPGDNIVSLLKTRKFVVFGNGGIQNDAQLATNGTVANTATTPKETLDIESLVLSTLAREDEIRDTWEFAIQYNLDHQELVGTVKSLLTDAYVLDEALTKSYWCVTDEGQLIANTGSLEYKVYLTVANAGEAGISMDELQTKVGQEALKIGLGPCMKNKWVKKVGNSIVCVSATVNDDVAIMLRSVISSDTNISEEDLNNLKRRKLVQQITRKSYHITKGPEFREKRIRKMADLTKDMLGNKEEVGRHNQFSRKSPLNSL